jgi:dolichol-phosphate mannosyltransferase
MSPYLILIPTYNEAQNITALLERLFAINLDFELLFIDDASPDGTADLIRDYQRSNPRIHLLERQGKLGLASAYLTAMNWALARDYSGVVQMDADLSHQPEALPALLAGLDHADLVIGSRYVSGGAVENWSLWRRTISRGGSYYARLILGVALNDLTGGYNVWSRHALEVMPLANIKSNGYSFQIEMKYRAHEQGLRCLELPISFAERRQGQSKLSRAIVWEAVWRVWLIRLRSRQLQSLKKFIKYSLVGATGFAMDLISLAALVEIWHWSPLWASCVSFTLSVVNNFSWNRSWTFRDSQGNYRSQFIKFLITALAGLVINLILMNWLLWLKVHYLVARILAVAVIVLWNFIINSLWTFRQVNADLSTD